MIYITGDCHGSFRWRFSSVNFPQQFRCKKNDYVIVAGDFGNSLSEDSPDASELEWLEQCPWTTLFVDGNHEQFENLSQYPVEEWMGGKVHRIKSSVIHLMRGQVYEIDGLKIFAFGGAKSHDISDGILEPDDPEYDSKKKMWEWLGKKYRINYINWWKEELPSEEEMEEGAKNLKRHGNKVDLIITHCAPTEIQTQHFGNRDYESDRLTDYLQYIHDSVEYRTWYFGHYHSNKKISDREMVVFDEIVKISELENFLVEMQHGVGEYSRTELESAHTVLHEVYELIDELDLYEKKQRGRIRVLPLDSLEAASMLKKEDESDVTVLNMASCRKIGGAVLDLERAVAQEESICLRSSLLLSLQSEGAKAYYKEGKKSGSVGVDWAVFSPCAMVMRDAGLNELSPEQVFKISVISAAAPEVSPFSHLCEDMDEESMKAVWERRILSMLAVCKKFGVKKLVLSAWGCGQYGNSPQMVAECFEKVLCEYEVRYCFDEIVFAILPGKNYDVFRQVFEK